MENLGLASKRLVAAGAILFLIGLIQGATVPHFLNPRMALSAHLTAVQSGTAIMVLGAVWNVCQLSPRWGRFARWAILVGMYGLWLGLTLSATTGASETLPLAGEGYRAGEAMEAAVRAAVVGSSAVLIAGWGIFAFGLIRRSQQ